MPVGADACALHHATEAPFPAADIQRIAEAAAFDARPHRRIQHEATTVISLLALLDDPRRRTRGSAVTNLIAPGPP
jgi:hypothetical protein